MDKKVEQGSRKIEIKLLLKLIKTVYLGGYIY